MWRLKRAIYGLRGSPKAWQDHFAQVLLLEGFIRLKSDPNLYYHKMTKSYVLVYVDDILLFGKDSDVTMLAKRIQSRVLLKILGKLEPGNPIEFLGRSLEHHGNYILIRQLPGYIENILELVGLSTCRAATTTGTKTIKQTLDTEEVLDEEGHSLFRKVVGKLQWLVPIRPDIAYATKELARRLTEPRQLDLTKVKHLLRYLKGTLSHAFKIQPALFKNKHTNITIDAYVDSDWAGCSDTRKSTSGVTISVLGSPIIGYSKTQVILALSSAEAELYAIGTGTSDTLHLKSIILEAELCDRVSINIHTDSTSGKSVATRTGTGKKTKHVELRFLYMQELVTNKTITITKIHTNDNPADVFTKYTGADTLHHHYEKIGISFM